MFVFREGRRAVCARALLDSLVAGLRDAAAPADTAALGCATTAEGGCATQVLDALLRAGELECALADEGSGQGARMASVTDALAGTLVCGRPVNVPELLETLTQIRVPEKVSVSPAEGFAYYALHPLNYSDLLTRVPIEQAAGAIVGIRSIGTTLGAIVKAALEKRGLPAERTSVRPKGHPFDRVTEFSGEQLRWIARQRARGAHFFAVDEGPGLSGSSFLSVGDALQECGVPRPQITFLCSRQPDVDGLAARKAAARWPSYRAFYVAPNNRIPEEAELFVSGGIWRAHFIGEEDDWPASWTQTERLKFLSRDRKRMYKFEGLGRFGGEVRERAAVLGDGGFAPAPEEQAEGFVRYPVMAGRVLRATDLTRELLDRMASYCAFRASEFRVSRPPTMLHPMLQFNASQEFGVDPEVDPGAFVTANPVITDSHMLPHEWLLTTQGELLKLDGASHGDDHFYPGPTDIAWDLAGAMVEWEMAPEARDYLVERYWRASGDDPRPRLAAYLAAYTMFRLGYCKMAAEAMRGSSEEQRLTRAYRRYRGVAEELAVSG